MTRPLKPRIVVVEAPATKRSAAARVGAGRRTTMVLYLYRLCYWAAQLGDLAAWAVVWAVTR